MSSNENVFSLHALINLRTLKVTNTCAVRGSLALRAIGHEPGEIGRTKWIAKGKRYLIRVLEMTEYMLEAFGQPIAVGGIGVATGRTDAQGNQVYDMDPKLKGKAGIVRFNDCG